MDTQPNIVWVTLDSVRADHTTMNGYERDTTPRLAEIAQDGVNFETCISAGNGTPVSSASMLTGTYPFRHGLKLTNEFLPDELSTVPELLGEAGYRTACISRNSFLGPGTGLDRGFDRFEWIDSSRFLEAVPKRVLLGWLLNIREHSAGLTLDAGKHATPYLVNGMAKRSLSNLAETEPFFLYLHYNEPHRPYYPPHSYLDEYTDEIAFSTQEAAEFAMDVHERNDALAAGNLDLSDDEWDALHAMYDAEIAYTDEMIGRLFDYVQQLDLEDTIFVVTADHGELLGEKGLLSHVLVIDDAVLRVPMVAHGLEDVGNHDLIQQLDVMQTIVERAGGDTSQFQGVDLRTETREYAFANRGEIDLKRWRSANPDFDPEPFHVGELASIRSTEFRYLQSEQRGELHKLPDEETDVSDECPDVRDELATVLEEWWETEGTPIESTRESQLDEAMREQLRDLGYAE
jgi:arylsulfatase A-like enzyme